MSGTSFGLEITSLRIGMVTETLGRLVGITTVAWSRR